MSRRKREEPWRYEAAIAEVETLIAQIESGELDLAEVVERFQQAAQTLKTCADFLEQKRQQVEIIIEQLGQGEEDSQAF
ncbi:exodeoxyribonuclease VII small subunit [Synechococcus sp. R55.8]|uniref:exodeoxyribonuclease VII small subunit n=1 Tax=Synechococcus sp. R55.8 TaxID=2964501 RepID=UPI0039C4BDA7